MDLTAGSLSAASSIADLRREPNVRQRRVRGDLDTAPRPLHRSSRTRNTHELMEMSSSRRRACLYGRTKSSGAQCGTKKETITAEVMKERGRWLVPAPLTSTAIFDVRRSGASSVECDVRPDGRRRQSGDQTRDAKPNQRREERRSMGG